VYSTPCTLLKTEEVSMLGRVKCITDQNGYAIYFSRGMIPCNKKGEVKKDFDYKLHLGLQCYDAGFLKIYGNLPATPLQVAPPTMLLNIPPQRE
jgi:3-deoxy-manno-octulosonate cytidylyltransferase (CMP-KDO synthetase)